MTRFARAKGSKASNERVPEEATSWKDMKQELEKTQNEAKTKGEKDKMDVERQKSYDNFIKEKEKNVKSEWAEFPNSKPANKSKNVKKTKNNEIDEDLIKDIGLKVQKIHKKMKKIQQNDGDDAAPEEKSAKIPIKKNAIKKAKQKVRSLKIKPAVTMNKNTQIPQDNSETTENLNEKSPQNAQKMNQFSKNDKSKKFEKKQGKSFGNKPNKNEKNKLSNENEDGKDDNKFGKKQGKPKNNKFEKKQGKSFGNKNEDGKPKKSFMQIKKEQKNKVLAKQNTAKVRDNKEHERRKPYQKNQIVKIHGVEKEIDIIEGFPVFKEDAERLKALRKSLISKGIPHSEIARTMKLERRKSEKALNRLKKTQCFNCREAGHLLSECPKLAESEKGCIVESGFGICFKCGSTEHKLSECRMSKSEAVGLKFAQCFICREKGHIARQCPDNPRGIYPNGGSCKACGEVTHLIKDCPKFKAEQQDKLMFVNTISDGNIESLDNFDIPAAKQDESKKAKKVVTF